MSEPAASPAANLNRVLILAPYRKDAEFVAMLLDKHGIAYEVCQDAQCLAESLADPPGVFVTTHEALEPLALETVAEHLRGQPYWSELPILILLDKAAPHALMRATLTATWPRSRQLFYQRPVAALELVSGVQSALLARLRQRDVRDYIERETELRRELNHRVKNILASVMSIFHMTRRSATTLDGFAESFEGRLASLAKVHSAVFDAGGGAVSLADVAEMTFAPYRDGDYDRVLIDGPDLLVDRDAGTTLALCFHELATNALKYGALSVPAGRVDLRWSVSEAEEPVLSLEWLESNGPPVTPVNKSGYGTRYLHAALASLFGKPPTIAYESTGLRCLVAGPAVRIRAEQSPSPSI